jgi:hypothetical protein
MQVLYVSSGAVGASRAPIKQNMTVRMSVAKTCDSTARCEVNGRRTSSNNWFKADVEEVEPNVFDNGTWSSKEGNRLPKVAALDNRVGTGALTEVGGRAAVGIDVEMEFLTREEKGVGQGGVEDASERVNEASR